MISRTLRVVSCNKRQYTKFRAINLTNSPTCMSLVFKRGFSVVPDVEEPLVAGEDDTRAIEEAREIIKARLALLQVVDEAAARKENPLPEAETLKAIIEELNPNGLTATLVMSQLHKNKLYAETLDLFEKLPKSVFEKCPKKGHYDDAKSFCALDGAEDSNSEALSPLGSMIVNLLELKKSGIAPEHTATKTAVIAASHLGDWRKACDNLDALRTCGLSHDTRMYMSALKHARNTCEDNGQEELSKQLSNELDELKKN